jgi:hypothetical protein
MKTPIAFSALALAGQAAAWYGQMSADAYNQGEGGTITQGLHLTDYSTGSTYEGWIYGGFDACVSTQCSV